MTSDCIVSIYSARFAYTILEFTLQCAHRSLHWKKGNKWHVAHSHSRMSISHKAISTQRQSDKRILCKRQFYILHGTQEIIPVLQQLHFCHILFIIVSFIRISFGGNFSIFTAGALLLSSMFNSKTSMADYYLYYTEKWLDAWRWILSARLSIDLHSFSSWRIGLSLLFLGYCFRCGTK